MFNVQCSPALNLEAPQSNCRLLRSGFSTGQAMFNECSNKQCVNALNHCLIDYSLSIRPFVHLSIALEEGSR